jgi:outer membrane immunogenic protein
MKRYLLATVGVVALGLATSASAADLGVRRGPAVAPVAVAPIYNWTGFYIGGHVGWHQTEKDWGHADPFFPWVGSRGHDSDGFLGGGQIGFNWQTGALVIGVEGQFSWTDSDHRRHCGTDPIFFGEIHCGHNVDWYATAAVRLGYAAANWLFYVKGGVAFADESFHVHFPGFGRTVHGGDDTETGWMVGVGIEYGFTPNWSAKIEYNYMDFGDRDIVFRDTVLGLEDRFNIDQQVHVVKFGINYRFGFGPAPLPVRAAY